jgi:hypothetical protein
MEPEGIVGVGSAALSVVGALTAGIMANRSARQAHELERQKERETQRERAERVLQQYRDPLLDAAHTLQARLFNIMAQGYLRVYLNHPDPDERRYARDYTLFAIAEYLCWVEILRRELRFHDLGDEQQSRELLQRLTNIQFVFQRDKLPRQFQVFRGRQRAIAELMMVPSNAPEGPRTECLGYATFCRRLEADAEFAGWFAQLQADVPLVAESSDADNVRLTHLQRELIDLIDFLDPKAVRLPAQFRARLTEPVEEPRQRTPAAG